MATKIKLKTAYDFGKGRGISCPELPYGRTKQSFKDDCDINVILKRFGITGKLPTGIKTPLQGDFSNVMNYHDAQTLIAHANQAFMSLPADIRYQFGNDAGTYLDWVSDPKNLEDARKLGLVVPAGGEATPLAQPTPVAPEGSPAPAGATPPQQTTS